MCDEQLAESVKFAKSAMRGLQCSLGVMAQCGVVVHCWCCSEVWELQRSVGVACGVKVVSVWVLQCDTCSGVFSSVWGLQISVRGFSTVWGLQHSVGF